MAYGTNPGNEDVLSDAPDTAPAEDKTSASEESNHEYKDQLVNSSICPGMNPGDEMVVKIKSVQEGQYLISYAPEESGQESTSEKPSESSGDKEMDGYLA